jgi:hypothetical protein
MRRLIVLAACLVAAVAACSTPESPAWQKAGSSPDAVARDTSDCRLLAADEARRRHPSDSAFPGFGAAGVVMAQQHDETNRISAEHELFGLCMQNRGYARTTPPQR